MTANGQPGVDPLIVRTWVTGWAQARETPPPVEDFGGFRVDVGWPEQRARYVFPRCSEQLQMLADEIVDPWIFLKACAPPEAMQVMLPPRWVIQPLRFMMTCFEPMRGYDVALPAGYVLDLADTLTVPIARILAANGDVAAIGHVAVIGDFAIYDRIETHQDHRRRGLGRAVMNALEVLARARRATRGVLVATADGRALYETLGWQMCSPYSTAVIPGADSVQLEGKPA